MSKTVNWQNEVLASLQNLGIETALIRDDYFLISVKSHRIIIHLVPLINAFTPERLIALQTAYQAKNIQLVHLWEDVWLNEQIIVLSRFQSLFNLNKTLFARKTKVVKITQLVADNFLNINHLQGAVKARYKFALILNDEIVAVATFSGLRKMSRISTDYKSAELIRFATKASYTITGGFTKLIKYFLNEFKPNDLMTYADRDWSLGESYMKLGFKLKEEIPAHYFVLNNQFQRVLIKNIPSKNDDSFSLQIVFNTGSLKFILYQ